MAGVALGAGAGARLAPLTNLRAKVLCPVLDRPLIDHAIEALRAVVDDVAVNVHFDAAAMEAHLAGRVHLSFEPEPLGTAGAIGALSGWLGGRAALIVNGDTWCPASLAPLLEGWDATTVRVMVAGHEPLHARSRIVASLLPAPLVSALEATPSGLWERVWRSRVADGTMETVPSTGPFADCATVADYLVANLAALRHAGLRNSVGADAVIEASIEDTVVGAGAVIRSRLQRGVVWPNVEVARGGPQEDVILPGNGMTILIR